jgi:inositol phosphorylceramide mannosyltransferase catalytic subunit
MEAPLIQKRIIQTARSKELPLLEKAATTNMRLLNPDFEYLFFDDGEVEDFIDREFPQYRQVVDSFSARIQRYDFFRYLAVYRLGGFYFDTDVLLALGLDDLLRADCVFAFEQLSPRRALRDKYGMDWELGNYGFGAAAGHPFLAAVIKNCIRAQQCPRWAAEMIRDVPLPFRGEWRILAETGPVMVTRTLAEYPCREEITVLFPDDVCDSANWYKFGSYGAHLGLGSWKQPKGLVAKVFHRLWERRTRNALLRQSVKHGKRRSLIPHWDGIQPCVPTSGNSCSV